MKKPIRLLLTITSLALWHASADAAIRYWDIDGAIAGAGGATPTGTWDTGVTTNWTADATGAAAVTTWASGDDAVFSAGTNATGAFSVILDNTVFSQNVGKLTFQEGTVTIASEPGFYLNIGGGVAGKGVISVSNAANATISSELDYLNASGDSSGQLTKAGGGILTLSGANPGQNTIVVSAGTLVAANNAALGDSSIPTVVSNGATLQISASSMSESVILNGFGVGNVGALRNTAQTAASMSGGAVLNSDASINNDGVGNWVWGGGIIDGTVGGNNYNLTFGGNSGVTRLNINANPSVKVGTGVITKEGASRLQFETPSSSSAFYFNGGDIFPRPPGTLGSGNVYVAATANSLMALPNTSCSVARPLILAPGANLKFDVRTNVSVGSSGQPLTFTCTGVISGQGGLTKIFALGILFLNAANTYTGNTTVEDGVITLGANGSISNSPVINVQGPNAIFNVTSNANGFVLQTAQTLKGNGTVWGKVRANGTIAPGDSVGSLTNDGNLTIGGNLVIEVDKSLTLSNDMITVLGTVTNVGTGTLTVSRIGGASLVVGDVFHVFNQAVVNGQTINVTGAGATWTNKLALNGSIEVLVAPTADVPATNLAVKAISPGSVGLGGKGAANSAYSVYASTNVALPMSNWWKLGTTNSSPSGVIQFLDSQATNAYRFYRFGQP